MLRVVRDAVDLRKNRGEGCGSGQEKGEEAEQEEPAHGELLCQRG